MPFQTKKSFAWSFSRYASYKTCPAQYRYKFILKLPEESSPALERGGRIHAQMAKIMEGEAKTESLKDQINAYPELCNEIEEYSLVYAENGGGAECQLAVDDQWERAQWFAPNTWCRGIIDLYIENYFGKGHALLVDWKTGKFSPHSIDDYEQQTELFCSLLFAYRTEIQKISPLLVFLDVGLIYPQKPRVYTREDLRRDSQIRWMERAMNMQSERTFEPTPNALCRWCSFSKAHKKGPCPQG
jgi:hypothetical protein